MGILSKIIEESFMEGVNLEEFGAQNRFIIILGI